MSLSKYRLEAVDSLETKEEPKFSSPTTCNTSSSLDLIGAFPFVEESPEAIATIVDELLSSRSTNTKVLDPFHAPKTLLDSLFRSLKTLQKLLILRAEHVPNKAYSLPTQNSNVLPLPKAENAAGSFCCRVENTAVISCPALPSRKKNAKFPSCFLLMQKR